MVVRHYASLRSTSHSNSGSRCCADYALLRQSESSQTESAAGASGESFQHRTSGAWCSDDCAWLVDRLFFYGFGDYSILRCDYCGLSEVDVSAERNRPVGSRLWFKDTTKTIQVMTLTGAGNTHQICRFHLFPTKKKPKSARLC